MFLPNLLQRLRARRHSPVIRIVYGVVCAVAVGCAGSEKRLSYWRESDVNDPVYQELTVQEVDEDNPPDTVAIASFGPRTVNDRSRDDIWDLKLSEAIQLALENNKIARTRNEYLSPGNRVFAENNDAAASVYDSAIRQSSVLFGSRGVEAALSSFDPVFNTALSYGDAHTIQNSPISSGGISPGRTLEQDTGQFSAGIVKNMAYGAQVGVTQNWNYSDSNQPFQLFPSVVTGNLQFNYQQPLWAGAGTEFTRIAGPVNPNVQAIAGVNQGVVIARINGDISLVEFEANVRNMIFDVESVYWDLYQAYRNYDSLVIARDAALETWQVIKAKHRPGLIGAGLSEEAQAREQYFEARSRAETALGGPGGRGGEQGIYGLELQLRRMCGLPANDGRIIRPIDEPGFSKIEHDWHISLATAFSRRPELRKQRWTVKSQELQLRAAKSLANPQLNLASTYQLNGFGNNLFGPNGNAGEDGAELQSAYRTQFQGDQTTWQVGLQFSVPLGLRSALSQVRHQELRLIKAQAVLAAQEQEVSLELAGTFQAIDYWYQNAETNYNRMEAARDNLEAAQAEFKFDRKPADIVLQAQNRLAIAEVSFYRSITEYNKALSELQYRQGTLLEYNNIRLTEGAWSPESQADVMRRARARAAAFDPPRIDPVDIVPEPFARDAESGPGISLEVVPLRKLNETPPIESLPPALSRRREGTPHFDEPLGLEGEVSIQGDDEVIGD